MDAEKQGFELALPVFDNEGLAFLSHDELLSLFPAELFDHFFRERHRIRLTARHFSQRPYVLLPYLSSACHDSTIPNPCINPGIYPYFINYA